MKKLGLVLLAAAVTTISCKNSESENSEKSNENKENVVTGKPAPNSDWNDLTTGDINDHWKGYNRDSITQWTLNDGTLHFVPKEGRNQSENLITKNSYTDFELSMEWKISEGGNSGFMWAVVELSLIHI